jgi:hypothetical protein
MPEMISISLLKFDNQVPPQYSFLTVDHIYFLASLAGDSLVAWISDLSSSVTIV